MAALAAGVTATATTVTLVLAGSTPAQADPPIGVGLLDPNCLVSVVLNGTTVCLVYVTPPTTSQTIVPTTTPTTGGPPTG